MFERIKRMVIKEFIHVFRDRRMKAVVFIVPIIQLMVFGYAVTYDVKHITTAVRDLDQSSESRELVRRFESSGYFDVKYRPASPAEVTDLLDRGRALIAIEIGPGFSSDLKKAEPTNVQVIVDGTDSNTAMVAMSYAARIVTQYGRDMQARIGLARAHTEVRTRVWYNPDLRSRNYNVPAVIAIMILLICLLLTSMAIVREREIGTMEQLMVTPIRPIELIIGKTLPFAAVGFFDMLLVTAVGVFWFDIPIRGSFVLLAGSTVVYLLSVLGIGLFISTISKTQQQALMATFLFFAPAILLSGFMFPIENMPLGFQYATYLNPLRYFLVIIRGIFLKGSGLSILWPQLTGLLVLGLVVIFVSSLRFKKRLS
jgi:ABC-2 type transport system permease protein